MKNVSKVLTTNVERGVTVRNNIQQDFNIVTHLISTEVQNKNVHLIDQVTSIH